MRTQKPKRVSLLVVGSGNPPMDTDIPAGLTVRGLLAQLGKQEGYVSVDGNPTPLDADAELYPVVSEGSKLRLSGEMDVAEVI